MKTTIHSQSSKDVAEDKILLQIRVMHQDEKGTMYDVTQIEERNGYGLKDLRARSAQAHSGLIRTQELLQCLPLGRASRAGGCRTGLSGPQRSGNRAVYRWRAGQLCALYGELFEGAMALPWISGIKRKYADRLLLQGVS